ncbi:hypothetical protein LCGC14_1286710, partial [marine sediment metagenome]
MAIYRSGLALQVATPNWPRWLVTLVAGCFTTLVACSPFVFTKLLDLVGIYGLMLMPVGAIVFAEHWILPRVGLTQYWVSRRGLPTNWPLMISWATTTLVGLAAWWFEFIHLFYLIIPVWVASVVLYVLLCFLFGAAAQLPELPPEETDPEETDPEETDPEETPPAKPVSPQARAKPARSAGVWWCYLSALVALLALAAGLVTAIWVAISAGEVYTERFECFKHAAVYLTAVYFVSAVAWIVLKDKLEEEG